MRNNITRLEKEAQEAQTKTMEKAAEIATEIGMIAREVVFTEGMTDWQKLILMARKKAGLDADWEDPVPNPGGTRVAERNIFWYVDYDGKIRSCGLHPNEHVNFTLIFSYKPADAGIQYKGVSVSKKGSCTVTIYETEVLAAGISIPDLDKLR